MSVESRAAELLPPATKALVLSHTGGSQHTRVHHNIGRTGLLTAAAFAVALAGLATLLLLDRGGVAPRQAPAVEFNTVDGIKLSLESLRGQVVLASFWDTGCGGCAAQMAAVSDLNRRWREQGLRAIAVAGPGLGPAQAREFARRHELRMTTVVDADGALAAKLGPARAVPAHVLIDRRGMIVEQFDADVPPARLAGRVSEVLAGR